MCNNTFYIFLDIDIDRDLGLVDINPGPEVQADVRRNLDVLRENVLRKRANKRKNIYKISAATLACWILNAESFNNVTFHMLLSRIYVDYYFIKRIAGAISNLILPETIIQHIL